jgi:hypothetical protein
MFYLYRKIAAYGFGLLVEPQFQLQILKKLFERIQSFAYPIHKPKLLEMAIVTHDLMFDGYLLY